MMAAMSDIVWAVQTKGGLAPGDNFGQAHGMDRPTWWEHEGKAIFEREKARIMREESAPDYRSTWRNPTPGAAYQFLDSTWLPASVIGAEADPPEDAA